MYKALVHIMTFVEVALDFDLKLHWNKGKLKQKLRAQSFTSLKADLRQDINGGFAFSLMEYFLEEIAPLSKLKLSREDLYLLPNRFIWLKVPMS